MELTASAPGKVFVIGEYGVIGGGPAVVATLTRRVRCHVRAQRGRGELQIHGVGGTAVHCSLAQERVDELPREARFVAGAALVAARALDMHGLDLEIHTESNLDPGATKTGLGGSAAVTAATVAALHGIAGRSDHRDDEGQRVATSVYAHRLVQGGGSGADVIAASVGGLVWVDGLDGSDVPQHVAGCVARLRSGRRPATFERLALPAALAIDVVASGRSCATGPRVARYASLLQSTSTGSAAPALLQWAAGMRVATEMFRRGCRSADVDLVLRAVRAAGALLSRLGALAAIPVFTAELRRACSVAAALLGVAAKPSGAGGGDCAIALLAVEQRAHLRRLWREAGLLPLDLDLDPCGARLEVTP